MTLFVARRNAGVDTCPILTFLKCSLFSDVSRNLLWNKSFESERIPGVSAAPEMALSCPLFVYGDGTC